MRVRDLILDVDGTLTDGKLYIGERGELFKAFNVKDGYAIRELAMKNGINPIIITGRKSEIVKRRCEELKIKELYQGITDKKKCMLEIVKDISYVAYIGDDMNDYECMQCVKESGGIVGCPSDASREVIDLADYVCEKKGGEGAVREFVEWILSS